LFVMVTERGPRIDVRQQTTVGEFQPVKRLQPRIIRSNYEGDY
jgi:hypothetical protein